MSLLSWFDNRTLYGCQCMLAVAFALVFLWMGRAYPGIRGIRSMTWAFLLGIPCTFLMLSQGHLPTLLSVVVANLLSSACLILLYDGIVRFIGGKSRIWPVVAASAISFCVICYYSEIQPKIVPQIIAVGLATALIRGLTAYELLRKSAGSVNRGASESAMRFFGIFLAILATVGICRTAVTAIYGLPESLTQRDAVQTSTMLVNVIYIGAYGLGFLMMAGHELITRSREESEKDLLSGIFNRRGIESRLSTELKRCYRSKQRLSVALVDIDRFKSINDRHGHAAGDMAIRAVSVAISRGLRDGDYLGRYGGDEFLIILPMTPCDQAMIAAQRLSRAVSNLRLPGGELSLTISIGITEASPDDDAIRLIARADEALYQAKSDGRDCLRTTMPVTTFPETPIAEIARLSPSS